MKISTIEFARWQMPLLKPFVTSGMVISERRGLTVQIRADSGLMGYGDIAPLPGFSSETLESAITSIESTRLNLIGGEIPNSPASMLHWAAEAVQKFRWPPSVAFGIELAMAGICAKSEGTTLARWYRSSALPFVDVNAVIDLEFDSSKIEEKIRQGYQTFKLKIGSPSVDKDIERVRQLRAVGGQRVRIRLDANRAYDYNVAHRIFDTLQCLNIEYIEEPLRVSDRKALVSLNKIIPVAMDESLLAILSEDQTSSITDVICRLNPDSFSIAVLKPSLIGSIARTLELADATRSQGKEIVVTSALDSPRAVTAAMHIACAARVKRACGFDTLKLFASPNDPEPFQSNTPDHLTVFSKRHDSAEVETKINLANQEFSIRTGKRDYSHIEFCSLVAQFAELLDQFSIREGSQVAILANNSIEYLRALFAIVQKKACCILLNTRLSAVELERQLANVKVELILTDDENEEKARLLGIRVTLLHELANNPEFQDLSMPNLNYELDRVFCILFTSGSSGVPKGVVLSLKNLWFSAMGSNDHIPLSSGDTWLLTLPLYHVGGLGVLFRCIAAEARLYLRETFDSKAMVSLARNNEITHVSLVPNLLEQMLRTSDESTALCRLKTILLGGAPSSKKLISKVRALNLPVVMSYGMTETTSLVTSTSLHCNSLDLNTCGRPLEYREIRLLEQPAGEICVRGDVVFKRYTDASQAVFDDEGWFHTGDIGRLEVDGNLVILGRSDEMIISGGENIFPSEIEQVVTQISGVAACVVVAGEDEKWGQRPILFVELESGRQLSDVQIKNELSRSLAKFKLPDKIIILETMPRTALGKIDKQSLLKLVTTWS